MNIGFLSTLLAVNICFLANAQSKIDFFLETEFHTKLSIGSEILRSIDYRPGINVSYPQSSTYNNPAYSLTFSPLIEFHNRLEIGISSGITVAYDENDPLISGSFFHQVMVPLSGKIRYSFSVFRDLSIGPEMNFGYQFVRSYFGPTNEGYLFKQSGGLLTGLKIHISTRVTKYAPFITLGYELNRAYNEVSLGWIDGFQYEDKIHFNTNYHLISLGLGIRM